jgi:hypothetical protein
MAKKSSIEPWEVALIKALLADGTRTRDWVLAHFSRPDRTVNPARITEIANGKLFPDIEPANAAQVEVFLRTYAKPDRKPDEAKRRFIETDPLHPVNVASLFSPRDGTTDILDINESDRVECKEGLHLKGKGRAECCRAIAGLANARGGFVLIGVRDADLRVVGIDPAKADKFDGADLNRYMMDAFTPVPVWRHAVREIGGKTIIIIMVEPAAKKPIICAKGDEGTLKEADIYYRYSSETRRIKYAELAAILDERVHGAERQWADTMERIQAAGVENIAILDTTTGEVSGRSGKFLIDEKLIPKLKFVAEGHFTENEGAPALRLVGDMEPISMTGVPNGQIVVRKEHLTGADLQRQFVDQSTVDNPGLYVGRIAHTTKLWLPVYYFMRQAGLDLVSVVEFLERQPDTKANHVKKVVDRLRNFSLPSVSKSYSPKSAEPERSWLIEKTLPIPNDEEGWERLLRAVFTLRAGDLDPDYVLKMLALRLDAPGDEKHSSSLTYAIAHVDVIWHQQTMLPAKNAPSGSKPPEHP